MLVHWGFLAGVAVVHTPRLILVSQKLRSCTGDACGWVSNEKIPILSCRKAHFRKWGTIFELENECRCTHIRSWLLVPVFLKINKFKCPRFRVISFVSNILSRMFLHSVGREGYSWGWGHQLGNNAIIGKSYGWKQSSSSVILIKISSSSNYPNIPQLDPILTWP